MVHKWDIAHLRYIYIIAVMNHAIFRNWWGNFVPKVNKMFYTTVFAAVNRWYWICHLLFMMCYISSNSVGRLCSLFICLTWYFTSFFILLCKFSPFIVVVFCMNICVERVLHFETFVYIRFFDFMTPFDTASHYFGRCKCYMDLNGAIQQTQVFTHILKWVNSKYTFCSF